MSGRFDWWHANASAILAHGSGDLAAFTNENGDVVLKQQDDYAEDDPTIIIPLDSADRAAAAIIRCAELGRSIRAEREKDSQPEPATQPERLALPAPARSPGLPLGGAHKGAARHG